MLVKLTIFYGCYGTEFMFLLQIFTVLYTAVAFKLSQKREWLLSLIVGVYSYIQISKFVDSDNSVNKLFYLLDQSNKNKRYFRVGVRQCSHLANLKVGRLSHVFLRSDRTSVDPGDC